MKQPWVSRPGLQVVMHASMIVDASEYALFAAEKDLDQTLIGIMIMAPVL
jgi:hypothetical protein